MKNIDIIFNVFCDINYIRIKKPPLSKDGGWLLILRECKDGFLSHKETLANNTEIFKLSLLLSKLTDQEALLCKIMFSLYQ